MKQFACPVCLTTFDREGACPDCEAELAIKAQRVPRGSRLSPVKPAPWTLGRILNLLIRAVWILIYLAGMTFVLMFFALLLKDCVE
jgi:predicted amidophosphoribosyltransferase